MCEIVKMAENFDNRQPKRRSSKTGNLSKRQRTGEDINVAPERLVTYSDNYIAVKHQHNWSDHAGHKIETISEIKERIKSDKNKTLFLKDYSIAYLMTEGFTRALLYVIDDLDKALNQDEVRRPRVLMYYGVSKIGKTSLARTLEFYLGLMFGTTWYMQARQDSTFKDHEQLVTSIDQNDEGAPVFQTDVVICDQINPAALSLPHFMGMVDWRTFPVIMFTSGHFVPQCGWEDHPLIKISVIHILLSNITDALRITEHHDAETVEKILRRTKITGHVIQECTLGPDYLKVRYTEGLMSLLYILRPLLFISHDLISYEQARDIGYFELSFKDMFMYRQYMKRKKDGDGQEINQFFDNIEPKKLDANGCISGSNDENFRSFKLSEVTFCIDEPLDFYNACRAHQQHPETELDVIRLLVKHGATMEGPVHFTMAFEKLLSAGHSPADICQCERIVQVICESSLSNTLLGLLLLSVTRRSARIHDSSSNTAAKWEHFSKKSMRMIMGNSNFNPKEFIKDTKVWLSLGSTPFQNLVHGLPLLIQTMPGCPLLELSCVLNGVCHHYALTSPEGRTRVRELPALMVAAGMDLTKILSHACLEPRFLLDTGFQTAATQQKTQLPSLKERCRIVLRNNLRCNVYHSMVKTNCIADPIKDFVLLKDVQPLVWDIDT